MPLPAYLLERLKKRKVILDGKSEAIKSGDDWQKTTSKPTLQAGESSGVSNYGSKGSGNISTNEDEEIIAEDYSDSGDEGRDEAGEQSDESDEMGDDNEADGDDDDNNESDRDHESETRLISNIETGDETNNSQEDRPRVAQPIESVLGCPNKYNIYHECGGYCVDKYGSLPNDLAPTLEQRKQLALLLRTFPMTNDWSVVYDPGVRTFYFWNIISNQVSWFPPGMSSFASPSADQIRRLMRENQQICELE